jgi:hypothetical protein
MGAGISMSCCQQAEAQNDFKSIEGKTPDGSITHKPEICLVKKTKAKQSYQAVYNTISDDQ